MNDLQSHSDFLNLLYKTHLQQKRALIDTASLAQIEILCEIILNIVSGIIDLDQETKQKFQRKKAILEVILKKTTSKKRKQLLLKNNLKVIGTFLKIVLNNF